MRLIVACWLAALLVSLPCRADQGGFSFALIGDIPYNSDEEKKFGELIAELNREPIAFVVHDGDFKSGLSSCSDELFQQRRQMFDTSTHPLIYVPGDNEWSDCRRWVAGGRDPFERLQKLRELFAAGDDSLGQTRLKLTRLSSVPGFSAYRENVYWIYRSVMFVGINVPGDYRYGRSGDLAKPYAELAAANAAWIEQTFAQAQQQGLAGLVLAMQANPQFEKDAAINEYAELIALLREETLAFGKPVLLVHGDTHRYRADRPLPDVPQLLRVETFGPPYFNWVRVKVDPADERLFAVAPGR